MDFFCMCRPEVHRGLSESWKICLNFCGRKWLKIETKLCNKFNPLWIMLVINTIWGWSCETKKIIFLKNTMTYVIPKIDIKVVPFTIDRWDERGTLYIKKFLPESVWEDRVYFGFFTNCRKLRVLCYCPCQSDSKPGSW